MQIIANDDTLSLQKHLQSEDRQKNWTFRQKILQIIEFPYTTVTTSHSAQFFPFLDFNLFFHWFFESTLWEPIFDQFLESNLETILSKFNLICIFVYIIFNRKKFLEN